MGLCESTQVKGEKAAKSREQRARTFKEFEPRCVAEVSLENLKYNISLLQNQTSLCLNLANNAYGHGAAQCAQLALSQDVNCFCVSTLKEGIDLREGGISPDLGRIIVMGQPVQMELAGYSAFGLGVVVSSRRVAEYLCEWGEHYEGKRKLLAYVLIDTSNANYGIPVRDGVKCVSQLIKKASKAVKFMGLITHAIDDRIDAEIPRVNLNSFSRVVSRLLEKNINIPSIIIEKNSNLQAEWNEISRDIEQQEGKDLSNIKLYSRVHTQAFGFNSEDCDLPLRKCLTLKGQVRDIRLVDRAQWIGVGEGWQAPMQSLVAIISCGFSDGYPRFLRGNVNKAWVRINGGTYKIVGDICTDHMMVHLGSVKNSYDINIGDYAVLFGTQTEDSSNLEVSKLCSLSQTSPTQLLCNISPRVSYHYKSTGLTRKNTLVRMSTSRMSKSTASKRPTQGN